jgi:hypothetical protein
MLHLPPLLLMQLCDLVHEAVHLPLWLLASHQYSAPMPSFSMQLCDLAVHLPLELCPLTSH